MSKIYIGTSGSKSIAGDVLLSAVVLTRELSSSILNAQAIKRYAYQHTKIAEEIERISSSFKEHSIFVKKEQIDLLGLKEALRERIDSLIALVCLRQQVFDDVVVYSSDDEHPAPKQYPIMRVEKCAETVLANAIAFKHFATYMVQQSKIYPYYGWHINFARPCKKHMMGLLKYGPSPIHRRNGLLSIAPFLYKRLELNDKSVSMFVIWLRDNYEPWWWSKFVDVPFKSSLSSSQREKVEELLCYYQGERYKKKTPIPKDFQQWCKENAPEPFF